MNKFEIGGTRGLELGLDKAGIARLDYQWFRFFAILLKTDLTISFLDLLTNGYICNYFFETFTKENPC